MMKRQSKLWRWYRVLIRWVRKIWPHLCKNNFQTFVTCSKNKRFFWNTTFKYFNLRPSISVRRNSVDKDIHKVHLMAKNLSLLLPNLPYQAFLKISYVVLIWHSILEVYTLWTQDINWMYIRRSENSWTSSERLMYVQFISCTRDGKTFSRKTIRGSGSLH